MKPPAVRKRLGPLGFVLVVLGILSVLSATASLAANLVGPGILSAAIGAGLVWFGWNTGAIAIECPACHREIRAKLKAGRATCSSCGHQVELRPTT